MSLVVHKSSELRDPGKVRVKALLYSLPGGGKTTFLKSVPKLGVVACETGQGKGLASIAQGDFDFVEPSNYAEFDQVCSGLVFKDQEAVALDSLSDMTKTFIKDYALSFSRSKGDTQKRKAGVPELDDYGVMGEVTRRLLRKLLDSDKHVIVTATLKIDKPDADTGQGQFLVCPDLPGALSLGSTAMFDIVLCLKSRSRLRNPADPKSRYVEHYAIAKGNDNLIAKCRHNDIVGKAVLPDEFVLDRESGDGMFPWMLKRIQDAYTEAAHQQKKVA